MCIKRNKDRNKEKKKDQVSLEVLVVPQLAMDKGNLLEKVVRRKDTNWDLSIILSFFFNFF